MGSPSPTGHRLLLSVPARVSSVVSSVLAVALLGGGALSSTGDLALRAVCVAGVVSGVLALRTVLGEVVRVEPDALVIRTYWPYTRRIPWYRIEAVDVLPGFWHVEVQLNSGERVALPPVRDLEGLYRALEHHRTHLDA